MSEETPRPTRNEIFNNDANRAIPTRDVLRDDFQFEVPVESVPLPSNGTVYAYESSLHGKETLEIRAMTAREEDILTSRALIRKGTVVSKLLESCLIDKSINPEEMLIGDRNAIMTAIRITGYGSEYAVEVQCPSCTEKCKHDFDLAELEIKRLELAPVAEGANLFELVLPLTKKKVRWRFLTGADERELMVIQERKKKAGQETDNLVTERFIRQVVAIDNVNDKNKVSHFIRNMPARDSLFLRRQIDKHEPGIDMKGWMNCIQCGEHAEVRLPMGAEFFWPDSD